VPTPLRSLATWLIGTALFVGLPLLGWGLGDLGGFFANLARLSYVVLVTGLNAVIAYRRPEVGAPRAQGTQTVRRQRIAVVLLQVLSLALVLVGPYCDRHGIAVIAAQASRWVGVAMVGMGLLVMHRAQMALGPQFSVQVEIQEGHRLVTDGLYRSIRHPRYLGILVFTSGIALVFSSWLALAVVAGVAVVLAWRIHDEETLMRARFGAEWTAYSKRTWRLCPFVF
jgi:protein-S-isoprenylcysteine O-methyltransferase Ste14